MALSFALILAMHLMIENFQQCFTQHEGIDQGKIRSESFHSCSKKTCRTWTTDVIDCSFARCRFLGNATPETITKLIMTSVNIRSITRAHFQRMKQLGHLDLGSCSITFIEDHSFDDLTNLKFLNLSSNRIQFIDSTKFRKLKLLTYLDLSNCDLRVLEVDSFEELIHLEVLNVSMNPSVVYNSKAFFSMLTNLKQLKLPGWNSISKFDMNTLRNLTKLEVLWFGPYQFQTFPVFDPKQTGIELPHLKELSLENNNIIRLPKNIGKGLESLETLILSGNRLLQIKPLKFTRLKNLKRLDLDRNIFFTPGVYSFRSNTLMQLSLNYIASSSRAAKKTFRKVPNLEELSLEGSRGIFKDTYPITSLGKLSRLNVKGNGIRSDMIQKMIRYLPKLRYLDLRDNELNRLGSRMFQNLQLEVLLLNDNWLTTVSSTSFPHTMWNSLKIVDLSGNPFECQCAWYRYWLVDHWMKQIEIKCSTPNEAKDTSVSRLQHQTNMDCFRADLDAHLRAIFSIVLLINASGTLASCLYRFRWQIKYYHFKEISKKIKHKEPEDPDDYSYDAFICYAEEDRRWVLDLLCTRLESEFQLKLCIQDRDWSFGEEILKNFASSIENSRKTVLILSNAFAISPWSHFEMTVAQTRFIEDNRDNLVLVLLEEIADCNMNPMINLLLQQRNHIEWTKHSVGQELFWDKLKHVLMKPSRRLIDAIPRRELFRSVEI